MAQRETRDEIISVKVNKTERARIEQAAQEVALPVSSFGRTVILQHIKHAERKAS